MNEMLKVVLSLSFSGALLIVLLLLFCSLFKERLGKRWQYYIWLVVVARLLLPFAPETNLTTMLFQGFDRAVEQSRAGSVFTRQDGMADTADRSETNDAGKDNLYNAPMETAGNSAENATTEEAIHNPAESTTTAGTVIRFVRNAAAAVWNHLWLGWLVTALILFIRKITIYQDFVKYLRAGCVEVADIDLLERFGRLVERNGIKTTVELYTNHLISSPLLIGFFRPCIILPTTELSLVDFDYTILHELTHFKRRDMFYKWLVQFCVCVHWFNPFVYLMSREISRVCELSCDEAVIRGLDAQGRRAYGDTLFNAIGRGGNYRDAFVSLTLHESRELLKERLDAIMNFKKMPKWGIGIAFLFTVVFVCGSGFLGAYAANADHQANSAVGTDAVSLYTNSAEIIGFQDGEETITKEVAIHITEQNTKIQLNATADGDSHRTLEVIDPNGEVVRTYTFDQNGFLSGSQEYLIAGDMIMVTDAVYPGIWYVRLSTDQTPAEKTVVTAKLVDLFVWGFASDDIFDREKEDAADPEDTPNIEDSPMIDEQLTARIYDYYRTYEQTKKDIQNGYIVNTGVSFSERMMPVVTPGGGTGFYVNHDNRIDLSITLENLIDGSKRHFWRPVTDVSFVRFEVFDPSGDVAYSFYKEGKDIENAVDIDTTLDVYPGEWRYRISFAYTTNGVDTSDMAFSLRYQTIYEDDIQWLIDHKLNGD
ncbi:MAG: M56 family metallopeptidase [Bacteroidales bacterium]|nr:M56 family metallopeptidase [Bacteroidales bacterium]MCM1417103.1 M56 family metallopeptidase [bacterium]MCM1424656.1 M56 family metallopeptidase [bacterium]